MKKITVIFIAIIMLISPNVIAFADDGILTGSLDGGFKYAFNTATGELKVDGTGLVQDLKYDFTPYDDEDTMKVAEDCYPVFSELSNSDLYAKYPWLNPKYKRNKLIFGDGITGAETGDFYCFKTVYFGASFDVQKTGSDADMEAWFYMIYDLAEKYEVSPDNKYMAELNGNLVSKDKTQLIKVPGKRTLNASVFYVPSGIKVVKEDALGYYDSEEGVGSSVNTVVFPKSVEIIEKSLINCKNAFVLNPKCKIKRIYYDGCYYYFNIYKNCMVYKAGLKKFSGYDKNREEYYLAPLVYKNTRYYALTKDRYTYTGKAIAPKPIVLSSSGKILKNKTDYTIKYSKGRKKVGKYSLTVKPKSGNKKAVKLSFNVVPSKVKGAQCKKKGTIATVKWKKHKTQTSGFQIQYSTDYEFSKPKTVTLKGNKATSKKIKKLKKNKDYFFRIRAYKKVGKKNYYSYWTDIYPN